MTYLMEGLEMKTPTDLYKIVLEARKRVVDELILQFSDWKDT